MLVTEWKQAVYYEDHCQQAYRIYSQLIIYIIESFV